jgi:pyruvate dehydrogenase E1 component alpha subunit/2-oxoisovalerate dehydrogenase E1 component alpha subunit
LNLAAVEKLPLVVVVADNGYAYSTPRERQFACEDLVDRAKGYGVEGYGVDGTDPMACWKVLHHAVERAREGAGPQLVVGKLLRLCGHGEHDDGSYVEKKIKSSERGRDCWREEAQREVEEAVAKVSAEPVPDPFEEDWRATQSDGMAEVMVAS